MARAIARSLPPLLLLVTLLVARAALASPAVQAPAGGRPITLPDGRVACSPAPGEWTIEGDPHQVRPPHDDAAIGHVAQVKIAPSVGACAASAESVDLVTTARLPQIDPASVTLAVDEGRLDLRGRGLRGAGVHWQQGDRAGDDRCAQPEQANGAERCSFGVARGLPADPDGASLSWFPAGGRPAAADVATYDANGRRVPNDELGLHPARVVVSSLVPSNVSIDLVGDASRVPLAHPEAVAAVDCGAASCDLDAGAVVVRAVRNLGQSLAIRVRLAPHVFFAKAGATDGLDPAPLFQVGVLPCAMSIASGDALRGVDDERVVVKLDARCSAEAGALHFAAGAQPARVEKVVTEGGAAYVLVRVGRVEGDALAVTALRGDTDGSVVGVARARVRPAPQPRSTLELDGGGAIDFIPTNRSALVRFASAADGARLVLLPVESVYEVLAEPNGTSIRGLHGAAGFIALRFGYRAVSLPAALASIDLAVIVDPVERALKEANVPAALGASELGDKPLVELVCDRGDGHGLAIKPGLTAHIPFAARDSCRVVFHRERLSPEDGSQRLTLDVDVTRVDGEPRPGAHVSQSIVLRPATEPRVAFIKGVTGSFDHVNVRVGLDADEAHYVGADEIRAGEPAAQWSVVAGEGSARLYGTTAIPTGLYRVSDAAHSGILALNFGVIMRLTWLDGEGHGGFLGLEGGVMGVGLANDVSSTGHSLTQVATVLGTGLSVPIANRSLATETSINLHAWFEYEVSRELGGYPGSPLGFVFGPSISIGNIGTNL